MSTHNTAALLDMYRTRNVAAVRTPSGVVFMGVRNLRPAERETLLAIPQCDLEAALRRQK